jgi:tetratricopeptide (TPR) repeat protein
VADSRIDDLRRRIERDPGSRLFAQLAEEHRKAGNHAEAIRVAREGLVLHPAYPSARLTLGRALLDSGDPAGARAELEAALRDAPDNILASRFLGLALEKIGDLEGSLVQLEKTLRMAPGDRQLESQIQSVQARLGARAGPPGAPGSTVRMRGLGGEAAAAQRAVPPPLPPPGSAPGAPRPATPPAGPSTPAAEPPGATESRVPGGSPLFAEPFYESDAAPTLPTAVEPEPVRLMAEEAAPTLPPGRMGADHAPAEEGAGPGATPLASSTLAELYYQQGLGQRAIEVYRQVVADEPTNERARNRLGDLEREGAGDPGDGRAARRRELQRMIAGLEAFLAAVRRR